MTSPVIFPPGSEPRPLVARVVVEALLQRTLTDEEWSRAGILLDLMWVEVLDCKPCPEATVRATAPGALAESVADMLRNPSKYRSESEGDYSYSSAVDAWTLAALPSLLRRMWAGCAGRGGGVFQISSSLRAWP